MTSQPEQFILTQKEFPGKRSLILADECSLLPLFYGYPALCWKSQVKKMGAKELGF